MELADVGRLCEPDSTLNPITGRFYTTTRVGGSECYHMVKHHHMCILVSSCLSFLLAHSHQQCKNDRPLFSTFGFYARLKCSLLNPGSLQNSCFQKILGHSFFNWLHHLHLLYLCVDKTQSAAPCKTNSIAFNNVFLCKDIGYLTFMV